MKPKASWKHQTKFPIQSQMADVIRKTIAASEQQLEVYRKKLRKLHFGS